MKYIHNHLDNSVCNGIRFRIKLCVIGLDTDKLYGAFIVFLI